MLCGNDHFWEVTNLAQNWTTKEIQYLKKNALLAETNEVLNIAEMAKKLNRTVASVRSKLYHLQRSEELPKIDRSKSFDTLGKPWTSKEDKRLIAMKKNGATHSEIAEQLERTKISVDNRAHRLKKSGKVKNTRIMWTEAEVQLILDNIKFDENGYVSNYNELGRLVNRRYDQIYARVSRLRKERRITITPKEGTTNVRSKQAMDRFNDARFAHVPKKKEEKPVEIQEQTKVMDPNDISVTVESREITLIQTTTVFNGLKFLQYFTKDGQLLAQKEPTPVPVEVSK